jgi:hypothetical protein
MPDNKAKRGAVVRSRSAYARGVPVVLAAAIVTLVVALPSLADDGSGYDLTSWTVDGGGAIVEAGGYRLGGTAGQPDAGMLEGGGYGLTGGFWGRVGPMYAMYLPLVLRGT